MPQCAKTLKIGSVLLKTGVFKVKNPTQFFKNRKILLFWRNCKKLLNYLFAILSVPAFISLFCWPAIGGADGFYTLLSVFTLPRRIEGIIDVKK